MLGSIVNKVVTGAATFAACVGVYKLGEYVFSHTPTPEEELMKEVHRQIVEKKVDEKIGDFAECYDLDALEAMRDKLLEQQKENAKKRKEAKKEHNKRELKDIKEQEKALAAMAAAIEERKAQLAA